MTTVLADHKAGVMVADSGASDGDRLWLNQRKVWRVRGVLLGFSGEYACIERFLAWWREGRPRAAVNFTNGYALALSADGLHLYAGTTTPVPVATGIDAIGSGGKCALGAYEALGWANARRAVQIACHHDVGSHAPVRCYRVRA